MSKIPIRSALISVYSKEGIDDLLAALEKNNVTIYSTGGTQKYIESKGIDVVRVEDLTSYPSILGGRVKTLHPKVFGGILARSGNDGDIATISEYEIPLLDLVVVDLYPFEDTVKETTDNQQIIDKIDIGGIALIRAAAKNYASTLIISSKDDYDPVVELLKSQECSTTEDQRRKFALHAFKTSSHYDTAIYKYFLGDTYDDDVFKTSEKSPKVLRYGENPHQQGRFFGDLGQIFEKLSGKQLSYNNLVDIDAAYGVMKEFRDADPTFAILKHTNTCGLATRSTIAEAWDAALAGDPISAFGGILMSNRVIDLETAEKINSIFYEVLIAPSFHDDARAMLQTKKKRVLCNLTGYPNNRSIHKTILSGTLVQDADNETEISEDFTTVTDKKTSTQELADLEFAVKAVKHLKSNTIVLVKDQQLIGMGCGQTSRVDACKQAIDKAQRLGFDLNGAVMASDAFFPFPDCVELAHNEGIRAVVQPGGSINDQKSIDFCNSHDMAMVTTGIRHFKH